MGKLHRRLNEKKDEIRLFTLLPKSRGTGVVHCTLETQSLKAFTSEERTFGRMNYFLLSNWKPASGKSTRCSVVLEELSLGHHKSSLVALSVAECRCGRGFSGEEDPHLSRR
jgi:hypothetical protein